MSSYVLDRELLLNSLASARVTGTTTSQWIDANSNTALLGATVYQRTTDTEIKRQMADLQDQLKMLRSDVEKKDKLISELSTYREIERIKSSEKIDTMFIAERSQVEFVKRELNTTVTKLETVTTELSEYKVKLQAREERINELKREIDTLKSENGTMNSLIVTLRNRVREVETDINGFEQVASKSGITITTLQNDNKDLQQKLLELESRIRTHMHEREEAERRTEALVNKLNELASKVTSITGVEITSNVAGLELLITKIGDIVNENSMVKGKLVTTTEQYTTVDTENKANRETIQRLVNELNKFEKDSMNNKIAADNLKAERDSALTTKTVLEKEIETLKERITNIQAAWQATKTELETKETVFSAQASNVKQMEYDNLYAKNCLTAFKEQVATLLSDSFVKVDANEDQIKEKIQLLMSSSKDRGLMIASMEGKIQQLANQLTEQINLYKELEAKYQRGESRCIELESRFKSLDSEFCANEALRDNLKSDRIKYLSFLEKIGNVLKISQISADIGLDMNIDLILARVEQLIKMENESIQDKQTNIYNLQRKCKTLKEQLDNKELHLDLLRKKLAALEEERANKCALEREVDDHVMMSKKFKLKVEKLTEQLNSLKSENESLKAQLLDLNCFKGKSTDQDKEISKLVSRISELESIKEKQTIKITKLKDQLESSSNEISKTRSSSDSTVQSLSQELRHLKQDLEKHEERERQLLDFRNVVARMLGLDASSLAVADYEIISRIERIISSFNEGIVPVHIQPLPVNLNSYTASSSNYNQVYSNEYSSSTSSNERCSSPTRRHHHSHSHASHHSRDRSPSPTRHYHHHHTSSSSQTRHRSKSPRKVTIDPNSY
ncbi:unnamed protein product [Brachionus calyciflorus]|uniref:Uncharacterized protein n=1 Tax=Brachionus calyciflorus TaxID=104777 RepID=A0A813NX11_9BILA|nr:unnamed protein product [Brachionus calyciflorus]